MNQIEINYAALAQYTMFRKDEKLRLDLRFQHLRKQVMDEVDRKTVSMSNHLDGRIEAMRKEFIARPNNYRSRIIIYNDLLTALNDIPCVSAARIESNSEYIHVGIEVPKMVYESVLLRKELSNTMRKIRDEMPIAASLQCTVDMENPTPSSKTPEK